MKKQQQKPTKENPKITDLQSNKSDATGHFLTTDQGLKINDDNNSLKAGERGPSLLEDFILREKITHFDHERIPERIVHARGSGAHGVFKVSNSMEKYSKAGFLQAGVETPVFARISTVAGFRGSTDLARDVRGFAIKFYTEEGNFDLVGNNMPVFFIQDAAKFPDLVHAVKPEPHNEIPQAASAHDTFWDFISLMPESMHMIMWVMSDRAIPRSLRMMEGFGVHTFRFINDQNESHFVKFHWKPKLGTHAVVWDEALKISGNDPDFHRRDLWEAIENGHFPEWDLGVQIIPEADEHKFDFDLLDPTKLIPEELVPVTIIGTMTLNRNPDNFFAETEQVAFHPGHIVPGIDFSNDPLLQGRLFSYTDTQLSRLGSPNFHEIPINRTIAPMHNNQRDGHMRQEINVGKSSYQPNSLGGGCPFQAKVAEGGFTSFNERVDAHKVRARSSSFSDHFSQAKLFYVSQTETEQNHIKSALKFELGKVETVAIRLRMLGLLAVVDKDLAKDVATGLGLTVPTQPEQPMNKGVGADAGDEQEPQTNVKTPTPSPALSMITNKTNSNTIESRSVAFICSDGVDATSVDTLKTSLEKEGAEVKIIGTNATAVKSSDGKMIPVDHSLDTVSAVLFDAVYVPSGKESILKLKKLDKVPEFLMDMFKHCKVMGFSTDGLALLDETVIEKKVKASEFSDFGIFTDDKLDKDFILAMGKHRYWNRETRLNI
ncbi:catalase [Flavobacterium sp.]